MDEKQERLRTEKQNRLTPRTCSRFLVPGKPPARREGCLSLFSLLSFHPPSLSRPPQPLPPPRIIWFLLSSPKEQNASGPIRSLSRSSYMIYAPAALSYADRGYLLIVDPRRKRDSPQDRKRKREISSNPRDHGYHLTEIVPRCPTCHVGLANPSDRYYNGCPTRTWTVVLQVPPR